jgi:hypothetical protein
MRKARSKPAAGSRPTALGAQSAPSVNRTLADARNRLINDDLLHVGVVCLVRPPLRRTPMRLHRARRSASGAVAAVALLCLLTSCGTSSAPTQTSPPEASTAPTSAAQTSAEPTAACADVAALKSSLQALTNVKPAEDGLTALTSAIADVKTNLDKAEASASPAIQPSVQQVKTAFAELQTAASGTNADNLKQKAPAIATAMKQVKTATQALSATLTQTCPGS